ncbi:hypothetical protein D9M69_666160 [compost metagenome]
MVGLRAGVIEQRFDGADVSAGQGACCSEGGRTLEQVAEGREVRRQVKNAFGPQHDRRGSAHIARDPGAADQGAGQAVGGESVGD